jgi:hypothetical protein
MLSEMNDFTLPLTYYNEVVPMLASTSSSPFTPYSFSSCVILDIRPRNFSNIYIYIPPSNFYVPAIPVNNAASNVPNVAPPSNEANSPTNNETSPSTVSSKKYKRLNSNDKTQSFDQKVETKLDQLQEK